MVHGSRRSKFTTMELHQATHASDIELNCHPEENSQLISDCYSQEA